MTNNNDNNDFIVKPPKGKWFENYWKPAVAWLYLVICAFDFLFGPLFFGWYSFVVKSQLIQNWTPLTLQGGGLFHLAFASIMGITAWRHPYSQFGNSGYPQQNQYPRQPQTQYPTNPNTPRKNQRLDINGDPI